MPKNPEAKIQEQIITMLRNRDWFVKNMHGNMYQAGFPDLFACHKLYGIRLIEVKLPEMKGSRFTRAQLDTFPKLQANGAKIWILTGATEHDYKSLLKPSNYQQFVLRYGM